MASHHAPAANLERSRNAPILASSVASSAAANSKTGAEAVESLISGGGFVGNVHDACPGYTAKQGKEKGQLIFDAAFESGNLGRVDMISSFEYDLFIRPDTCSEKYQLWFYFSVRNVQKDQRAIFNIVNFSKTKSLYSDGMSPVVWSTTRPKWMRLPSQTVFYYRCPDHNYHYVMSFAFMFDVEDDLYKFAYCIPYTYSELQRYLSRLSRLKLDYCKCDAIGSSVQQRRLDMITISNPENLMPGREGRMKTVVVTGRVHPGETPASFVCKGLIDFLISDDILAKKLRTHVIFHIIPMLNPDGVYLGNYRCSFMGTDLNRRWDNPLPWGQPTIYAVRKFVFNIDKDKKSDLCYFIDLHAHSTLLNAFLYGNSFDDVDRSVNQAYFPRLVNARSNSYSMAQTAFNRDPVKAGTARRYLGGTLRSCVRVYTLEVSFLGFIAARSDGKITEYTPESYADVGVSLGLAFADALLKT